MATPNVFDFESAYDTEIIKAGIQGFRVTWFGIDPVHGRISIVCDEGTLNAKGDGIDTVTLRSRQVDLEGTDFTNFRAANKEVIDALITSAMNEYAIKTGRAGKVVSADVIG
jgi:hypothetical protein